MGFPCGSAGKESACSVGDLGLIPGLGRCPGEGKGYPLRYSGLENSMDCRVHGVAKSRTQLSNFHFQCIPCHIWDTHSTVTHLGLPWWLRQLRTCLKYGRPGFDPWVGKIPWRRERLPTPVFLGFPGGSAGKESVCNAGDLGSIPGLGNSPGQGNSYPL